MDNKRSRDADNEAVSAYGKRVRLDQAAIPVELSSIKSLAHQALSRSHSNDNVGVRSGSSFSAINSIRPTQLPSFDYRTSSARDSDNSSGANGRSLENDGAVGGFLSNSSGEAANRISMGNNAGAVAADRAPSGAMTDITRRFQQAVSTGQERRSPTYVDADVMIVYWQEDYNEVKDSVRLLESVFQHSFYYATEVLAIPSVDSEKHLYLAVEEFFSKNSTPDKLAVLYYAGRSVPSEPSGGPPLWIPRREGLDISIKYKPIETAYRKSLCDVLLLLDNCNIRHPHYTKKPNGTARRKVVEVVDAPPVDPDQTPVTFSKALAEELVAIAHGEPLSVEALHKKIVSRMIIHKPRGRGRPPKEFIVRRIADQLHLPHHYFLQECRSIILAPIPDVPQVVLCIRVPNCAQDLRRWGQLNGTQDLSKWVQWIYDADPKARSAVQIEGIYSGFSTMIVLRVPADEWEFFPECPASSFVGYTTIGDIHPDLLDKIDAELSAKLWVDDSPPLLAMSSRSREAAIGHDPAHATRPPDSNLEATPSSAQNDTGIKRPRKALPTERKLLPSGPGAHATSSRRIEQAPGAGERPIYRQPLDRQQQLEQQEQQRLSQQGLSRQLVESGLSERDALLVAAAQKPFKISIKQAGQNHMCSECKAGFKDIDSLRNHIRKQHTRPFHCVFNWAGCESTFASKNEWKRHVMSQHILLHYWVCQVELCSKMVNKAPGAAHSGFSLPDGSIFNRKDLFTQHLRRMHTPTNVRKLMKQAKAANKTPNHPDILEWENRMKDLQQAGIKPRCRLPDFMICPSPGCGVEFHGSSAWDDRMEHVARHLEGAAAGRETLVVFGGKSDPTLTDWATRPEVGIAKRVGPNEWHLDNPLRPEIREWTENDDKPNDAEPVPEAKEEVLPSKELPEKEEEHPDNDEVRHDTPADDRSRPRSVIEVADPDSRLADDYSDSDPEQSGDRQGITDTDQAADNSPKGKDVEDKSAERESTPRQPPPRESSPSIVVSQ